MKLTQDSRPDQDKLISKPTKLGQTPAWSYSTLKVFEECPYRIYISKVKKVMEPSSPAASRGSDIHQQAEDYVAGKLEQLPSTLEKFETQFRKLRSLYDEAKVELEGEWGFDIDWQYVGWMKKETWARIKLDALVVEDDNSARVIDYKTGKKIGNEIGHSQQCLLYAIGAFAKYPDLEYVKAELWYLDQGETTVKTYTRKEAMTFMPGFHRRALAMTTCEEYEPKPSKNNCKWCSYKKGDHPECIWGIT